MSTSRVEVLECSVFHAGVPLAQVEDRLVDAGTETPMGRRG
jgi:hypothetical protein